MIYKLTVLLASNTLLSILHDLASSFGTRQGSVNYGAGGKEVAKKLRNFSHAGISTLFKQARYYS